MKKKSKKKRYTRKYRLASSADWVRNFEGENIIKAYSRWYGVPLLCAIKELRSKGIEIEEAYEREVKEKAEAKRIARQLDKERKEKSKIEKYDEFSDERFAFIAGYTSGGAAYGVTHEEMQAADMEEEEMKAEKIEEDFEDFFLA